MDLDTTLNDEALCRSCMARSNEMKLLNSKMDEDSRTLWDVLRFVTNISGNEDDNLPKQICEECISSIIVADRLKRNCQKSQEILRSAVTKGTFMKNEEPEVFCQDCLKHFESSSDYSLHMECHSSPYQCSICLLKFQKAEMLENHLSTDHQSNLKKFECSKCDSAFVGVKEMFIRHVNQCAGPSQIYENGLSATLEESFDDMDDSYYPQCKLEDTFEAATGCGLSISNDESYVSNACGLSLATKKELQDHDRSFQGTEVKVVKRKAKKFNGKLKKTEDSKAKKENKTEPNCEIRKDITGEKDSTFKCDKCPKSFTRKHMFTNHLNLHENKANNRKENKISSESKLAQNHTCAICKREFQHQGHLENHILKTHGEQGALKCEYCPNTFATQPSLDIHLSQHKDMKKHQCHVCNKAFGMLSTLKDHLRVHTGEKPFLCSICGKGFTQKTNLQEHVRRHTGYKPFQCNTCDQRFVSKGELTAHMRKHTGAHPFVCTVCGASFTTSGSLNKHKRRHTGERPYQCVYCPMRFMTLGTMKKHHRTHTGEKPYKCTYCDKTFAQKNDVVTHTRCHTGERPYVCSTCGQSFRQSTALKTHLKLHSIKDPDSMNRLVHKKETELIFSVGIPVSSLSSDLSSCSASLDNTK